MPKPPGRNSLASKMKLDAPARSSPVSLVSGLCSQFDDATKWNCELKLNLLSLLGGGGGG